MHKEPVSKNSRPFQEKLRNEKVWEYVAYHTPLNRVQTSSPKNGYELIITNVLIWEYRDVFLSGKQAERKQIGRQLVPTGIIQ